MKLVIEVPQDLQCSLHELQIMLGAALTEYRVRRCCGNAEAYVQEREQRYSGLYEQRSPEERADEVARRTRQFADAEALRNAVGSGFPALMALPSEPEPAPEEPCHYCGATDGFNTEYDGWPRCNSCPGC